MGMSGDVPGAIEDRDVGEALLRLRSGLARLESGPGETGMRDNGDDDEARVSLNVRAFPLLELLSIASENGHYVVWTEQESLNRSRLSDLTPGRSIDPSKVVAREDLTVEEKVALLKDWQLDLTERMTATDENMSGTQDAGQLAEQHRHVSRVLSILEPEDPEH